MRGLALRAMIAVVGLTVSGCSTKSSLPIMQISALMKPVRSDVDPVDMTGTPATIYTAIARGAMACWFGPKGFLDRTYIWHAAVVPEADGGGAEITVHERSEENYRGRKALIVRIAKRAQGSSVLVIPLKVPEALAVRMRHDAFEWAEGKDGCPEPPATLPAAASPAVVATPAAPTQSPSSSSVPKK